MKRFLITGGAGFIGSHIAENLLKQGEFVRVLDNLSSGRRENIELLASIGGERFEFIMGDIRDQKACDQACTGVDAVLHQAALRSVPKSMKDPHGYNAVNIDGVVNMLDACVKAGVRRFVFASSSSVYGDTDRFPEREDQYPLLISPYALSKLAGEYYCRIYAEHFGVSTVCLRYFNVFGPRQALDDEYAVVVPKFIHCLINDEPPPVYGTGRQSRDFTYIDNVVAANIAAATKPGLKHEVVNVALGRDHSVLELVEILKRILGKNIAPRFLDPRPGDVLRTQADVTRLREVLGIEPRVDFEEGLRRTVESYRRQWQPV